MYILQVTKAQTNVSLFRIVKYLCMEWVVIGKWTLTCILFCIINYLFKKCPYWKRNGLQLLQFAGMIGAFKNACAAINSVDLVSCQ